MKHYSNQLVTILIALNIVCILLFLKMPVGFGTDLNKSDSPQNKPDNNGMRMCFFDSDELNENLLLSAEFDSLMNIEIETVANRLKSKQKEALRWNEMWVKRAPLSASENAQYQQEVAVKEAELAQLEKRLSQTVSKKEQEYQKKLISAVEIASKTYAEQHDFDFVFSYEFGQGLYFASDKYNITKELIKMMNADYNKE